MADSSPPPSPPPYDDWEFIAPDYGVVILDDCLFSDDNAVVILGDYIFSDDNGDKEKQSEIEKADDEEEEEEEEEEEVEHDVTSLLAGLPRPLILNRGDLNDGELYDEEDDDVDYETDDMDDELVPQGSKGRLVKDRIRKIGKRGGPRVTKRVPYYHNRPGCLRGKHGFGVQQTFYI